MLFLAVLIGAFGAHGLKEIVTGKYLDTFDTGVRYHFYHSLSLLAWCCLKMVMPSLSNKTPLFYILGVVLFSFNCYLYAVTKIKLFAMIVPIGGFCFLFGHGIAIWSVYRENN